jgi:hypothetical protein
LHDIAGVQPARQRRIQPQGDHASQCLTVDCQQAIHGRGVSLPGLFQEFLRLGRVGQHGRKPLEKGDLAPALVSIILLARGFEEKEPCHPNRAG